MPKAYDVKHNYYADLELPTSATVDEVKKQYRKLALLYHPDRNAGREEEVIAKFQAIQAANEILSDPLQKNKYDADRRRAGLYPGTSSMGGGAAGGGSAPRGNPYQAASAYPPPPRRTQPGTWQRPGPSTGTPPTGADRFTNFPRQTPPTAKRADPAAERQNAFHAWQNMSTAQNRQNQPQPQHSRGASGAGPGQPPPTPRRPQPPPRQDTKFPTDEKIRAGFNYREPPSTGSSTERAEDRQSAWASFQQSHANKPGVSRSNTTRTPKKQGFDPNVPGSDERAAPDSSYVHRHKSEDFGRPSPVPPPPPGPPPSQPETPTSPSAKRPFADPLRPFKSRTSTDEDAPYSEGNRVRTPYSSYRGEKTDFSGGMRRSNSTRDNTKLSPNSASSRARSTSPLGRQTKAHPQSQKPAFATGASSSSAESSEPETTNTPEQYQSPFAHPNKPKVPPQDRPKKVPSPPSKRFTGPTNPTSPPTDGANADPADAQQKSNMYVHDGISSPPLPPYSTFRSREWQSRMFGHGLNDGLRRKVAIPKWAMPASVMPVGKSWNSDTLQPGVVDIEGVASPASCPIPPAPASYTAVPEAHRAYSHFRVNLGLVDGPLPEALDMDAFLKLASYARHGQFTGHGLLDRAMKRTLDLFPNVGYPQAQHADQVFHRDRFSFPISPDTFSPTVNPKARSEESINTKFSADGWSGTFAGSGDYFAPPPGTARRNSPSLRNGQRPGMRSATSNYPQSPTNGNAFDGMPPPPKPAAANESVTSPLSAGSDGKFNREQWEATLKDGSWTWPPPPPKPPGSPSKSTVRGKAPSRKGSRNGARSPTTGAGTATHPQVVDEDDDETVDPRDFAANHTNEPEPMDIDHAPPTAQNAKEPRMVSVPPSAWRQQQHTGPAHPQHHHRNISTPDSHLQTNNLNTTLSDLTHVAPFTSPRPSTENGSSSTGLKDMTPLSSSLPFPSQAATTLPTHPLQPQKLQTPMVPKPPDAPTRLTKKNWHLFAQNFALYLRAFHSFNSTFLSHFQAREAQSAARMKNGLAWLEATGDTVASSSAINGGGVGTEGMLTGPSGWGSYERGVKEDEHVREVWTLGCERHREAVRGFEEVRERVRRLVVGGGLQ